MYKNSADWRVTDAVKAWLVETHDEFDDQDEQFDYLDELVAEVEDEFLEEE